MYRALTKKQFFKLISFLFIGYVFVLSAYVEKSFYLKHGYSFFFGKRPLISVLVTSYNYEQYLAQTLDSILAQTYKNYEVVIVDDGSKDNSVELIDKYTKKYSNFHLYQHEGGINKGLPASIKFGVEKANGEYIAFLESDDYWRKDKLEEVVKMINKYPDAVIISNNIKAFGDVAETMYAFKYLHDTLSPLGEKNDIKYSLDIHNTIPTFSSVVIKRDVLLLCSFDTPIPAFIDLFLYKQIWIKHPLYYINKTLTFWRRHMKNYNTTAKSNEYREKSEEFSKKLQEVLGNTPL